MDKDFQLAKKLLKQLNAQDRWYTLAEIEKVLMISDKTIRKIVEELNDVMPSFMKIEVSRGKGIHLKMDRSNHTVDEVISNLFRHTNTFKFLHMLFVHNGQLTFEELAEELFISESSLKKMIIQFNKEYLHEYDLKITYAYPQIKGNEIRIRYFYWQLYNEAYSFSGWPFKHISYDRIECYIETYEKQFGLRYFINSKRRLTFLIAITLVRITQQHTIQLTDEPFDWGNEKMHVFVQEIIHVMQTELKVEWSISEQRFLQAMFSRSQYHEVRNQEHNINRRDYTWSHMSIQFLSILAYDFPNLEQTTQFKNEIHEFISKLQIDNAVPEILSILRSDLTEYVKKAHPQIFDLVSDGMKKLQIIAPSLLYNDYHLTRLTLLIRTHLRYKRKKAFLLIGEEFSIRHYVALLIKKEIGDALIINTSIMEGLTDEIVQEHQIDFVISNFPLHLNNIPTVIISTIPTKRDIEKIRQQLIY